MTSRVVLIGEVPGDREDLAGKPFVVPPASDAFCHDFELVGAYWRTL